MTEERTPKPDLPFLCRRFRYPDPREECVIISEPRWVDGDTILRHPSGSWRARSGWYVRILIHKSMWPLAVPNVAWRWWESWNLYTPEEIYEVMVANARRKHEAIHAVTEQAKDTASRAAREAADFRIKWGIK